jgi:isoleucyl-tRNA synthetase
VADVLSGNLPVSVHLCDYPVMDGALLDDKLSNEMEALLRLVSLGSAARNAVKIKVRQPLAEIRLQPADDYERGAIKRFADQIGEELNIKKVACHDLKDGKLVKGVAVPNLKPLSRFGARRDEIATAITQADGDWLAQAAKEGGPISLPLPSGGSVNIESTDFSVQLRAAEGWAGVVDGKSQVAVDARVTPELAREGLAREVIRHVQSTRKDAGLEMEDRIELHLSTEAPDLRQAIDEHRGYIGQETLTAKWAAQPLDGAAHQAQVKVDGKPLRIALRKSSVNGA